MTAHALYRFYDEAGHLIYIGITNDPGRRFTQHGSTKVWWRAVRGISLEWHLTRTEALAAEKRAIKVERPMMNVVRASLPDSQAWKCGHCWNCADGDVCLMVCELDDDEGRIVEPCTKCGSPTCIYVLGYDTGNQHGFSVGLDYGAGRRR